LTWGTYAIRIPATKYTNKVLNKLALFGTVFSRDVQEGLGKHVRGNSIPKPFCGRAKIEQLESDG